MNVKKLEGNLAFIYRNLICIILFVLKLERLVSYSSLTCFNLDLLDGNQGMLLSIHLVMYPLPFVCL